MKPSFWEAVAADWDDQVFDTLAEDRGNVISTAIREFTRDARTVADFGCGVGRYLPLLAVNFQKVFALDWATACINRARVTAKRFPNVEVLRATSTVLAALRGKSDFTVAIHVVTHPRQKARERALSQAVSLTKSGGRLLIVVPSLESAVYAESVRRIFRPKIESDFGSGGHYALLDRGVLALGGLPTKHFVAEELLLLVRLFGCIPTGLRRIEYSWRIHSARVPRRYAASRPWDWLVLAKRE